MKQKGGMIGWLVAVLALSSLACSASGFGLVQGSGRVVERAFEVEGVSGVELTTLGNLTIEIGDEEALRIRAEDNLIDYFEVNVVGDRLQIRSVPFVVTYPTRPVEFRLTVRALDTIRVTGSGNVYAPDLEGERVAISVSGSGSVETGDLIAAHTIDVRVTGSGNLDAAACRAGTQRITVSGSGNVRIEEIDADALDVHVTGSGNVTVAAGRVGEQSVLVSGSGDYTARRVEGTGADVRVSGSGCVTLQASDYLNARVSGSGDVRYAGNPTVNRSTFGSGDIVRIGD